MGGLWSPVLICPVMLVISREVVVQLPLPTPRETRQPGVTLQHTPRSQP